MSHDHDTSTRRRLPAIVPAALAALVLGLLVLALPSSAHAAGGGTGSLPPGKSWVRAGHFVPGMGTTTIKLQATDGSSLPITLATGASYGQVTAYDKLAPGHYTATVRSTSATPDSAPMLSGTFDVQANSSRTLAIVGTSDQPRLAVLTDDLTPPAAGTARVRFLSASDAADSVSVQAVGGPTIASGAVLGQTTGYTTVPAGTWALRLRSGTADTTLQDVSIASGSVYTVVALDSGSSSIKLHVVTDAAGAVVAPRGGAKTGEGGTAPGNEAEARAASATSSPSAGGSQLVVLSLLAGLLAASSALVLVRRRRPSPLSSS